MANSWSVLAGNTDQLFQTGWLTQLTGIPAVCYTLKRTFTG